jgi:hypothetical protein
MESNHLAKALQTFPSSLGFRATRSECARAGLLNDQQLPTILAALSESRQMSQVLS